MIKLIVCDFDGTLVGKDIILPEKARGFARKLHDRDIMFTLATGRSMFLIDSYTEMLDIQIPLVTQNGAVIQKGSEVIFSTGMEYKGLSDIISGAETLELSVSLTSGGIDYVTRETEWFRAEEDKIGKKYRSFSELRGSGLPLMIEKVTVIDPEKTGQLDEIEAMLTGRKVFTYVRYGNLGIEITAPGVNKAAGVEKLAEYLEISRDDILAIGDSENDTEMLSYALYSGAVGNAIEKIKNTADFTAENYYFDGVVEIINHFC